MNQQCVSIRGKGNDKERCSYKAKAGSLWCGHHAKQKTQIVFVPAPGPPEETKSVMKEQVAAARIHQAWRRWLARRCGPLLWFREESNNPADFYSGDPIADIPIADFVSFVEGGKGYVMDVKSAQSLIAHGGGKEVLNPFNRAPLPPVFLRRLQLHSKGSAWECLQGSTPAQTTGLAITDLFRTIEDLGYYTDPAWLETLDRLALLQVYIELADIWYHRATLRAADRNRIVPGSTRPFDVPVVASASLATEPLRTLVIRTCRLLVSTAVDRADRQLGIMYVMGALTIVSAEAAAAYPWIVEMFAPGVTRIVGGTQVGVSHPSVLAY
jgi:hypothetical protein